MATLSVDEDMNGVGTLKLMHVSFSRHKLFDKGGSTSSNLLLPKCSIDDFLTYSLMTMA